MRDIRYDNSFRLAGGFNITNAEPIDSRIYVTEISHIYLDENWVMVKPYPGLIVSDPTGEIRICVNSDYTQESSWLIVRTNTPSGDNNDVVNTVVANNYTDALTRFANEANIGLFIYILSDETIDDVVYAAGPYVISGVDSLIKISVTDYTHVITGATYNNESIVSNNTIILDNFITSEALTGYTYNKTEIDNKFKSIDLFSIVEILPEGDEINPNKIYLINNRGESGNTFTEYIYADGKWEIIGNLSVDTDFTNYYTKGEVESKLNTNTITLSEDIKDNEDDAEPVYYSGKTVQEILKNLSLRIKNINAGGTSAAINIVSGTAINITEEDDSTKISVIVSKDEDNAISVSENDGGLYVESLKARVEELEKLLENVITINNIGNYAVTSISYANSTDDIKINGITGAVTLELDSITNIAYGDAEPINEIEEF